VRSTLTQQRDVWSRVLVASWALVGVCLLIGVAGWIVGEISSALLPFLLATVIVYLFKGWVEKLEQRGWKRAPAVLVCYVFMLAVSALAIVFLVPAIFEQLQQFVKAFPSYYDKAYELFIEWQDRYERLVVPEWIDEALLNLRGTIGEQVASLSAALAREAFTAGSAVVAFLANAFLSLVLGFWLLKDLPKIRAEFVMLAGPKRREEASTVIAKVSRVLGGYLRGQFILSAVTSVIVIVGLSVIGVPYSLVIGLLAGVFNVIPWVGPAIAAVIAALAGAFVGGWHIVGAVLVILAAQQSTEIFVQPRVMSQQVDLHPVAVIFSLLVGGAAFGFWGMVLAIPVTAVAKGLFVYYYEKYTDRKIASEEGALFRVHRSDEDETETDGCHADGAENAPGDVAPAGDETV
jgi:predicted PurR-regulated permease PerM